MNRPDGAVPQTTAPRIDDEHRRILEVYAGYSGDAANASRWSSANAGNQAIIDERMGILRRLAADGLAPLRDGVLLDVGCGSGVDLDRVATAIGHRGVRVGVDLRHDALVYGTAHAQGALVQGSVFALPFADRSVAVVTQSVMISSVVDPDLRRAVAAEIDRVLVPGGLVLSYDMRVTSRHNPNVTPVRARELAALFADYGVRVRSATVAPPIVRRLPDAGAHVTYGLLRRVPVVRTHEVAVLRKPDLGSGDPATPVAPVSGKVTHLTSVHTPKDVRIFLKEARTLAAAGIEVSLVAPDAPDETVDGVRFVGVPKGKGRLDRALFTTLRVLRAALAQKSQVYHFHDFELIPVGVLLKLRGRKVVYDVHESVPDDVYLKEYLPRALKPPLYWFAKSMEGVARLMFDAIVPATPAIARRFLGPKCTMVQNFPILGELVGTSRPFAERSPQIAYVGNIEEIRGVREVADAIGQVDPALHARLALAGPFDPPGLADEIATGPSGASIRVLGQLSRGAVAELLADSRAGIVTFHPLRSHIEAQPNKLFEYMSAGLPVIASDFPLWREIVDGAGCGLLVDPLDPKAIAEAMATLVADPDRAEALGRAGQTAVVERFSWGRESKKLVELYRQLLRS